MTSWNAHEALHQDSSEDECGECAINKRHTDRWAEARAAGEVTFTQARVMAELHRQDWVEWKPRIVVPIVKHDKLVKIKSFILSHHGEEVTLEQIMVETEAAQGTAYSYIREMSLSFRRVGTSRYRVSDPGRARAEALAVPAPTIPQDGFAVPGAWLSANPYETGPQRPKREPSKP